MEDLVYYNELFLIYSSLLTENEINSFKDYYFEDLSLSEIAENKGISRAAVQKTIKNVIDKLISFEDKLHIYENNNKLNDLLEKDDINIIKEGINNILGN